MVNTLFKANNEAEAVKSLRNTHWWIDGITDEVEVEVEVEAYRGRKRRWGSPIFKDDDDEVKKFIINFRLMHPNFVDAVGSGIGLQLQGLVRAVTHQVLKFAEVLDLPVIPFHEEYLVQEEKKDVIEEILRSSMQVALQKAGQYGTLNAKCTCPTGGSNKVEINLAHPKVGRFS